MHHTRDELRNRYSNIYSAIYSLLRHKDNIIKHQGKFSPSLPITRDELRQNGLEHLIDRLTEPFIKRVWYVYVCLCLCVSMSMWVYVYVCLCLCVSMSMCVCVYVCLCLCVSVSMCVCVYVYVCLPYPNPMCVYDTLNSMPKPYACRSYPAP